MTMFSNKKETKVMQEKHQETSLFGKGSTFTGCIETTNDLRIDGKVIGEVIAKAKMVTGTSSIVEGPVKGIVIEINGTVVGDITATETLILRPSAIIEGNINATNLSMEEGARFNGQCQIGKAKSTKEVKFEDYNKSGDGKVSVAG